MAVHSKILLRKYFQNKDGKNQVYLCLTINRQRKWFPLEIYTDPKSWDEKKSLVKKSDLNWINHNKIIGSHYSRALEIISDFNVQNRPLTFNLFTQRYLNVSDDNSVFSFIEKIIESEKDFFKKGTLHFYKSQLTKLQRFSPTLTFNDIDMIFLKKYYAFMEKELDNNENTVYKAFRFLKSVINRAIKEGLVRDNVFAQFPIKTVDGLRQRLTIEEIQQLNHLLSDNILKDARVNVLRYFLFSCYTGLRYTDVKKLTYHDVQNGSVYIRMDKTRGVISIPLTGQAKNLIGKGISEELVFQVFTNQATNRYLKEIMQVAGINKPISFHSARHTFATCGLELGIPIEVVSKLLGHKHLATTQIYAKITDTLKIREMKKWENV
ncbi:MAG: site-specific integrase [Bacteroidia bacterium]|nr:site-specific integrase [Bacteroidia bacterium]